MAFKKWNIVKSDKTLAKQLAEECDIDPITALIALGRGYSDEADLEQFLSDEAMITSPYELVDIKEAATSINQAIKDDILIAVYGDYDCDGICATAVLTRYLNSKNVRNISYIPDRCTEGYGMNKNAINKLNSMGVGLIVTVDNGICSCEEISYAYTLGMKVVVTDHHIPLEVLPLCEAVVDPHREDCTSTYKEICGAEVAYKLVCVLDEKEPEELLKDYCDILTIATIADVMPLNFENRCIVKAGLKKISHTPLIGIQAIINVAGLDRSSITSGKIAFGICPRINAAGRVGDAKQALNLMITEDMMEALAIANELETANLQRQNIEKEILAEAFKIIDDKEYYYDRVIVVSGNNWHSGVVGIVAARICEKYGKPTIVLSVDGDTASGSGRSFKGFSLYKAISSQENLLIKFGGHELAAGISIKTDEIDNFRNCINKYALSLEYCPPELTIDCRLNPAGLSLDVAYAVKSLEPFGAGNPIPIFGLYGVTLKKITPLSSGKHLRLLFSKDSYSFQSLLFGVTERDFCFNINDILDLAVTLDTNVYNNTESLSVQIKNIKVSGTDDTTFFSQLASFESYISENVFTPNCLLPTRGEVGIVYKYIASNQATQEKIKYNFINSIGYSKTMISLLVLSELKLIDNCKNNSIIKPTIMHEKTDLNNSQIYKDLCERSKHNEA